MKQFQSPAFNLCDNAVLRLSLRSGLNTSTSDTSEICGLARPAGTNSRPQSTSLHRRASGASAPVH